MGLGQIMHGEIMGQASMEIMGQAYVYCKPTLIRDPAGIFSQLEWCRCGALQGLTVAALTANAVTTRWSYDLEGRLTAKTYADGKGDIFQYQPLSGWLLAKTDAKGQATQYTYGLDGAVSSLQYGNAVVATPGVSMTYDPYYPRLLSKRPISPH